MYDGAKASPKDATDSQEALENLDASMEQVRWSAERREVAPDLEFRLLGTIDVVASCGSIVPTSARQRDLLALLLLDANMAVSSGRLIDRLWQGAPPATAMAALQVYIAKLRAIINGYSAARIITVADGYRLDAEESVIDSFRFEEMARRGHSALVAGSTRTASETLRSALDLWRGDALSDVRHLEGVRVEVTRLEEMRCQAIGTLIDAELALGHHVEMIPQLEGLVEDDPLRERRWAQLMLALYRGGRQSDAMRAYQRVATILGDELGIEPGPDLYNLEERILLQDPALMLVDDDATSRTNLERAVTSFIGRQPEIERLIDLVEMQPLVTLTGPGGAGKTRLAREIGSGVLPLCPDGVWFVDLSSIRDPSQILFTIAETLGVVEKPDLPMVDVVHRFLHHRSLLLILDNCEHLLAPTAELVRSLLASAPLLTILATSRERLGIEGEMTWTVPPLTFPAPGVVALGGSGHEAVDLFVERARLVDPGFEVTASNQSCVAAICRRLDGLPLAIELAAARVDVLSLSDIEDRLSQNFSLLDRCSRIQPMRHATLTAAVRWSYELLDDEEGTLFGRLSVFTGRFLLDDVEFICVDDRLPKERVFDVLTRLVDKSLVMAHTAEHPMTRYSMLETLRGFAAEVAAVAGDDEEIAARHAVRFLALAVDAETELRGVHQREWLDRLEADHDNLRLAFERLLKAGQVEDAMRMGSALMWFWKMHDNVAEGTSRLESALASDCNVSPIVRSRALTAAAVLKSDHDIEGAYGLLKKSRNLARSADDALQHGMALGWMGLLDRLLGHLDVSERHLNEALGLVVSTRQDWAVAFVLGHLGVLARERGLLTEAAQYHEHALLIAKAICNPQQEAWNVAGLGIIHLYEGEYTRAIALLEDSYKVQNDIGFDFESATVLIVTAISKSRVGDQDAAASLLVNARHQVRRLGSARLLDAVCRARATVLLSRSDPIRAAQLCGAAHRIRSESGLSRGMFQSLFDADEHQIRAMLGEEEFAAAWELGRLSEMSETTAP